LAIEMEIDKICSGLAIVADDIAHQDVEHVVIDRDGFAKAGHGGRK
jgi:hypothetical protein